MVAAISYIWTSFLWFTLFVTED